MKTSNTTRKKPRKLKTLVRLADEVHSKYVRLKETENGCGVCVSCGEVKPYDKLDCGHFVGRSFMSTRYWDKNTHIQCISCNRFHEGAKDEYALWLIKKYGVGIIEELNKKKREIKQWEPHELEELIKDRRAKIKELN